MGSAALLVGLTAACGLVPGLGGNLDLAGRAFVSTSVTVGGVDFALVDGTQIRIGFSDDGMMTANAGCNHFGAPYRIDGGVLVITDGAVTEMACQLELAEQDEWVFALLGSQPLISLDGDELVLQDDQTIITLLDREVVEPDLPLVGPVWTVTALINGDAVTSVPEGVTATIVFTEDGLVMVNTGCNSGNGSVDIRQVTIRFGDLALTRMACEGAAAQMEAAMLRVLRADVVGYTVDASTLELSIAGYGLQLTGSALL